MANDRLVCEACGADRGCECHARATRKSVRDKIVAALEENPYNSDRQIAKKSGATAPTVAAVRQSNVKFLHKDRTEASGRRARGRKPGEITDAQRISLARAVLDQEKTHEQAIKYLGLKCSVQVAKTETAREEGRREAQAGDPSTLSMSAREKLEAALRQHKRNLDVEFEQRVQEEARKRLEEMMLPSWQERLDRAAEVLRADRYGVFSREEYRMILSCLHPDSRGAVSEQRLSSAFDAFKSKERVLTIDMPVPNLKVV